jgi:hypothetical protein
MEQVAANSWESKIALAISVLSLATIIFTYIQVRDAERAMQLAAHQQLILTSLEYDKFVANNPELRPYFRDGKPIASADAKVRNQAAALADMLLDIIDGNIEHTLQESNSPDENSWLVTFQQSFKSSPILCEVYKAHHNEYSSKLQQIGDGAC